MKETLIDIVDSLDSCADARRGTGIAPLARVRCIMDGVEITLWLCSKYYSVHEIQGLQRFGRFIPKNSDSALKMQKMEVGESFDYETQYNKYRKLKHHVVLENRSDLQNFTIAIAGDTLLYQFRNIHEFLATLQQNREDIKEIDTKINDLKQQNEELKKQKNTAAQRSQITKSINELQKEYRILTLQQEDLKNITIYIRKQGEMRYSLIVDPIQTSIKSQNLFDGTTVVINGGPGTGKSTTMIHRLSYLTDRFAIDEDEEKKNFNFKLDGAQRRKLREAIDAQRDWIFFSPSQMLKDYLADAMRKEDLINTYEKVKYWKEYCQLVLRVNYRLLGDDISVAPFKVCHLKDTLFYQDSGIVQVFTNFFLDQFRAIKGQLPRLKDDVRAYSWTVIAQNIQKRINECDNYDLGQFISLFNMLESVYGNDCKNLILDKDIAVNLLTEQICELIGQNNEVKANIEDVLDLSTDEVVESLDSEEEGNEDAEISEALSKGLKKWLIAYCYSRVNEDAHLSDEQQLISEYLLPVLGDVFDGQIKKIGDMLIFEQYAQYTKGIKSIILSGLPAKYKKFRTYLLKTKFEGCNLVLLSEMTQRSLGKELHYQEQSLLLGFINTLVKQIKKETSAKIKHTYISAYEEVSRPIIGIDEATDFCACEIYAMQSLLTLDFNSLTLCGDMMQRLTGHGIKSWSELDGIIPNPVVVEMKTSYRQSKKLLDVAKRMYQDTLGETPIYKAFMKSNKVPAPLVYVDDNETAKIGWISKRISEVYRAYGDQLPSIAIFVNDKGYIPDFADRLQHTEFFKEHAIQVLDGSSKNKKPVGNHICVYPIEVVKGMEFDVVFFHNIDNSHVDTEILKRYIYVGVSRAAFFLGITLSEQIDEICKYFEKGKDWFKI